MTKKLTDRQKSRLWAQQRSRNFQASSALEGLTVPLTDAGQDEVDARLDALRERYAR
ncbi:MULTISPECIES: YhfG family protein [Tenebrionibacter/Tenebrionicola group]|jgi:hypothetical protein|uniref:DUF2559 family protein n=2 Tax=Tenebrionibacter/Tenebrionicola group TaxID=2969848 RepID=A0A8K0V9H4_9ENTR|nr:MULTISPECIES: YhfG family protein [Tenebrionibacter/Tenebrionicola group]MBK4716757.1 DUF2559 family protein [Tenebrionibacter intestinalis]MBV5097027.1 DUF2559 family protein [Tenebrionicola larvae]